jgi:hypothetical protein
MDYYKKDLKIRVSLKPFDWFGRTERLKQIFLPSGLIIEKIKLRKIMHRGDYESQ